MSEVKRQVAIFAALAASFVLGTIVSEYVARSTRATSYTDLAPMAEAPVDSVASSTLDSLAPTMPQP